ncbi:MAG: pantoate--beta-alanine ligase [Candidatus Makaraimicrobium thalassicum]|nr:MAG: pantoate--beta-alanine ligase [Candidatus Omnitrophota bacterium]
MQLITSVDNMRKYSRNARQGGRTTGFVPTMGYLHEGHLSLVRAARKECDVVVMSIFVNPDQFGPGEDFDKYPRDMQRDRRLAEEEGVDAVFAPSAGEMYPDGYATYVEVTGGITEKLCGGSRPGHFRGVTTVVAKLFNAVLPDKSYFGQKDAAQAVVIKRMVRDLNMPVDIRVMPIVREVDGLAMSSRNTYLSEDARPQALGLFRSLKLAEKMIASGELSAGRIKEEMRKLLEAGKDVRIDYIEIADAESLESLENVTDNALIAVAAFVGTTRLIDNVIIRNKE